MPMRKIFFVCLALLPAAAAAPSHAAKQEDVREALETLEQAVKEHPQNAELHVDLAFAYKKLGRVDDAQAQFEAAVKDDPAKAEAYYMLGLIYEKKGLKDKAETAWKACYDSATEPGMKATAQKHLHVVEATKR